MQKMQQKMMQRYGMIAWIGMLLVLAAFALSFIAVDANASFFGVDKATREAAATGSSIAIANAARHSIATWVPAVKFLGLGVMLGAITMALGQIALTLRNLGLGVMRYWPSGLNPGAPELPRAARLFPMAMLMGWMLLFASLIWALAINPLVLGYWNHSIAANLNPAGAGSVLLGQLGRINGSMPWIQALRFGGMASLFTGVTVALTVIIRTLQHQEQSLRSFIAARAG